MSQAEILGLHGYGLKKLRVKVRYFRNRGLLETETDGS